MTYRNLFFSLLVGIFCCIPSPLHTGMMMPNMDDFEKELAEANRAIEEYVASLPPAEQAEFNQKVEEMSRMFENMSEDEFEQFLGEMFADEPMMMEPNPFDAIEDVPQEETVEVVLSADDKKKVETAVAVLDDIIKQSNMFMVIVNSSSELPERINQWAKKDEILHWQPEADWITLKSEIETFIQKLYRVQEQDLTTKKYKYLFELIADEALYNNLIQLRTELNNIIPTIDIPEFTIQKLSQESKTALKNALGKYTESFYLLDIPKGLDTLFEKYAPEEEKIKAAEEAATKKAQEASRMTRTPASKTQAGSEEVDYGYGDYYGGGYDNYYGGDYGYGNDYGYSPNYGSYGGGEYGSGGGYGSGRSGGGSSGGGESLNGSGSRGTDKEKESEKEEKDKKNKKDKKDKFTPQYEVENAVRDIKKDFDDIKAAMTETEDNPTKLAELPKFAEHIINNDEKIDETLVSYILPRVIDKKIDNISIALKKIDKKELNADDLAHYQKEIKKIFDEHTKQLTALVDMVDTFETEKEKQDKDAEPHLHAPTQEGEAKKINVSTLSSAKQWAYFGGSANTLSEEESKLAETITPVSLFDISNKIVQLLDDVKKFASKVAKAPKKTVVKEKDWSDIPEVPTPPSFE